MPEEQGQTIEQLLESLTLDEMKEQTEILKDKNAQKIGWFAQENIKLDQGNIALILVNMLVNALELSDEKLTKFRFSTEHFISGYLDTLASVVARSRFTQVSAADLEKLGQQKSLYVP